MANINHVELALSRLGTQWGNAEKLKQWVEGLVFQDQDLEDTLCDVVEKRQIDTATGQQLDILGKIVGQPRLIDGTVYEDTEYRQLLKGKIVRNYTASTPEEVIAALLFILDLDTVFIEEGGTQITVGISRVLTPEEEALINEGLIPKTAGVLMDFFIYNPGGFFSYQSPSLGRTVPGGQGYGSVAIPTEGGEYATLTL